MMEKLNTTTLQLSASLDNLEHLSQELGQFIAWLKLDPAVVYQLELAACEAFSNIVRHGVNYDPQQWVGVTFCYRDGELTIELCDTGKPIPAAVLQALEAGATLSELDPDEQMTWPESGIGLKLIFSMMDHVSYRCIAGHNRLSLLKHV
ncbi:ATP-binding protein [Vibrio sp. dsl-7]|uniref:ATP-binding protein n=1 Tax=Vibrio chanodichtyis TaxID=3027932 RepID=A0ABT5V0Y8_9VIBR|nr:ATP-binding protein [Vibrio chanodichtyis]MDE1515319.1 ATP-binding protein [Vibrio chanodichtyis]